MKQATTTSSYWFSQLAIPIKEEWITDKNKSAQAFYTYNLQRCLEMFEYKNLPDTVPEEILETYLLTSGVAFFTKVNGEYYVFQGTLGGEPDVYYRPQLFIVANPALSLSKDYEIGKDGILLRNDKLWYGLNPLLSRTSYLLAENLLTMKVSDILLRMITLLTATDERTKRSAEIYLDKISKGELGVISSTEFYEGLKMFTQTAAHGSFMTQFIELHQYTLASFYNEIGLNSNYNMKRESITASESILNEDMLMPLCDNMLLTRKQDIEKINQMFNLNIEVDYSSTWKENQREREASLREQEIASQLENGVKEESDIGEKENIEQGKKSSENDIAGNNRSDNNESNGREEESRESSISNTNEEGNEEVIEEESKEADEDNEKNDEEIDFESENENELTDTVETLSDTLETLSETVQEVVEELIDSSQLDDTNKESDENV